MCSCACSRAEPSGAFTRETQWANGSERPGVRANDRQMVFRWALSRATDARTSGAATGPKRRHIKRTPLSRSLLSIHRRVHRHACKRHSWREGGHRVVTRRSPNAPAPRPLSYSTRLPTCASICHLVARVVRRPARRCARANRRARLLHGCIRAGQVEKCVRDSCALGSGGPPRE